MGKLSMGTVDDSCMEVAGNETCMKDLSRMTRLVRAPPDYFRAEIEVRHYHNTNLVGNVTGSFVSE